MVFSTAPFTQGSGLLLARKALGEIYHARAVEWEGPVIFMVTGLWSGSAGSGRAPWHVAVPADGQTEWHGTNLPSEIA